ncbi:hypothetical protein [Mesorhizobium sp.]|uniref:hypothetical protein n=1 Tax=Mesorhizobium sp. TaxID=1871066 RepID=UPI000FE2EA17|nr:hypothetical protein [Mesorhizobium sp.]RWQ13494.1 MAG: hypothetical protein EOR92_29590 [Mesorhizobium sp.]
MVAPAFGDDRDEAWVQAYRQTYHYSGPMPSEEEYIAAWRKGCHAYGHDVEDAKREAYRRAAADNGQIWESLTEEDTNLHLYLVLQQRYISPYFDRLRAQTVSAPALLASLSWPEAIDPY